MKHKSSNHPRFEWKADEGHFSSLNLAHVPALRRWSPVWSTLCPRWTAGDGSPWSTAYGGWRRCRGWRGSWATARSCSRAAWGSDPGLGRRAGEWEGWSHTAVGLSAHPRIYTTWGGCGHLSADSGRCLCCENKQTGGTHLLPLLLAGAKAIQVQRERSWSSYGWWSCVKAASDRSSTWRGQPSTRALSEPVGLETKQ